MEPQNPQGTEGTDAPIPVETLDAADEPLVLEDLLLEDVSIDGMCGVY